MATTIVPSAYDPVWKSIHWCTVALVLALLAIGWTMSGGVLFMWHASLGVTVFVVTLLRLVWHAGHVPPPVPPTLRPWERKVLKIVQVLFYVFLIVQPLTGWSIYSLSPRYTQFFGWVSLPKLPGLLGLGDAATLRTILEGAHGAGASILAALFVLHAGAAMKHHFIIRDDVLLRMAPSALGPLLETLRGRR
ncbi:cytochrome B561 [Solidesulfovibrio fructosivorans JJ]]|uniref:Cytochrome B561 n=1 Tax=Solidesulfovibrio fructosivorans JJ] TaxID=596151 RepID=E1JUE2_SOLFR|nr:cytochrome b/b6 domain-containing protein [Solidesulfovibrio fructosivorans]EFL52072.1 cytochrome B561 [Solidesulfovibrio fructosivorans JJ]]